jgi:tetratricopeptide (TPR) repeat protein
MRPAPATPPEALEFEGAAEYAFKNAKSEADFVDAAQQYEKALLVAPWKAADYFNLGVAQEKARQLKPAIQSLELYLLALPNANDTEEVRKRIGGLRFAAARAERQDALENARQAEIERRDRDKEQQERNEMARLQSLEGSWSGCNRSATEPPMLTISRAPNGELIAKAIDMGDFTLGHQRITDRYLEFSQVAGDATFEWKLALSADGKKLNGSRKSYWRGKFQSAGTIYDIDVCRVQ